MAADRINDGIPSSELLAQAILGSGVLPILYKKKKIRECSDLTTLGRF